MRTLWKLNIWIIAISVFVVYDAVCELGAETTIMKVSMIQTVLTPAVKAKVPLLVLLVRARWLAAQILLLTLLIGVLLWLSIFLYGAFYYSYMPTVMHERPVYFKFR